MTTCDRLAHESEEFWEETDQGNQNIFYSRDKDRISEFLPQAFSRLEARLQGSAA